MNLYGKEYWWSIGGFIGVLTILNIVGRLSNWVELRVSSLPDTEGGRGPRQRRPSSVLVRLWRSFTSLLSIFLFRLSFPLRSLHKVQSIAEFACVGAYIGATVGWTFMNTDDSVVKNWSGRAGVMAAVQVPFIIALAGKNNVITWLTGLSHERLNVIHRAAGRACFSIAWIHGGAMFYTHTNIFHKWGMVALAGLSAAALLSFRAIRNFSYELFLMGHILFIAMFVTGLLLHEPNYQRYSYPGLVFWAFDRFLRFTRMAWINFSPKSSGHQSSSVELLSADTVRLSITRPRRLLTSWKAGQHFFVIAPGIANLPWEAHPFTASTIPHALGGTDEENVHVDFIIRGRDGFTGNLLKHAIRNEGTANNTFILDGPYGQPPNLGIFDTAILIAGGSGVSYTLSLLLDRIYQAQMGHDRTSRVLFIWAVRQEAQLNWIAPALQRLLHAPALANTPGASDKRRRPLDIDIRIFITQQTQPRETITETGSEEKAGDDDEKPEGTPISTTPSETAWSPSQSHTQLVDLVEGGGGRVRVMHGRPDVHRLIEEELAISDGLKVSVDVSGPGLLADAVKHALATSSFSSPAAALRGGPNVTLHSEVFGW
ncbi:hypothetical protein DL93DRAFT_2053705 [Clavulina sp. PMI_390]|nr:hypothetical protein DL93DRAFT_2053705 [Clavulina sp. PMI_390]